MFAGLNPPLHVLTFFGFARPFFCVINIPKQLDGQKLILECFCYTWTIASKPANKQFLCGLSKIDHVDMSFIFHSGNIPSNYIYIPSVSRSYSMFISHSYSMFVSYSYSSFRSYFIILGYLIANIPLISQYWYAINISYSFCISFIFCAYHLMNVS